MHYLSLLHASYTKGAGSFPTHKAIGMGLSGWVLFRGYLDTADIDSLAERMGVTRYEVTQFINGWLGERFLTVRKRLRVHDASEMLLKRPDMSIAEISRAVGFQDKSDFRRAFTTEKRMTPSQWRESGGSRVRYRINRILEAGRSRCP